MLTRLKIKNFVLIDELELDFSKGLTVLTGETGSGKSIIIDALMLIFGSRIVTDIIRIGSTQAELLAEFTISNQLAINWLSENDLIDLDNPNNIICRRVIDNNGKNKIYLNSNVVTSSQIRTLGEFILDIHTQHAAITLLKPEAQRNLLDEYAGINKEVLQLNNSFKEMRILEQKLEEAVAKSQQLNSRKVALNEILSEFKALNLKAGEWAELETRHKQLANIGLVLEELDYVQNLIQSQDTSLLGSIHSINSRLNKIASYIPNSTDLLNLSNSIEIEFTELNRNISNILNTLGADPKELENLDLRMNQIFALSRKYRITPEQIIESVDTWQSELDSLDHDSNIELLQAELAQIKNNYMELAKKISGKRTKFALELSNKVAVILHNLAINGEFRIISSPISEPTSHGLENIEFQVCFNKGMNLQPLAKVASGGELSRTALALYLLLSMQNSPDIIIFDEIDVGISGKIASQVGELLRKLSSTKQVICITHQPQTASFGTNHIVVSKDNSADKTLLNVAYVSQQNRVDEIARMLGGMKITPAVLTHAKEMLGIV